MIDREESTMWFGLGRFGYGHMLPWMTWVGPIGMLVVWALVVTAIVFLIRYLARQSKSSATDSLALAILKERYARGEINKEEFDQKRKDIL
jgi:putative membrane protein